MADVDFDDYGASPRIGAGQVQRLVRVVALGCSMALVVGAVVWGYRLAERDVAGIPLIAAPVGPMRVAPDLPGGSVADHQGMAINAIAAIGNAEALPDEIVLAPAPFVLDVEDVAGLTALPPSIEVIDPAPPTPGPAPLLELVAPAPPVAAEPVLAEPAPAEADPTEADPTGDAALAMALAEALSNGVTPLAPVPEVPVATQDGAPTAPTATVRPRPRPDALVAPQTDATLAGTSDIPQIDPATLALGTRLVQLGAFDSADQVRGEWVKLLGRFGDLMTGKTLVIEAAESGGSTFYRLRAHGFAEEEDVRRFCAALKAENAPCIPAMIR